MSDKRDRGKARYKSERSIERLENWDYNTADGIENRIRGQVGERCEKEEWKSVMNPWRIELENKNEKDKREKKKRNLSNQDKIAHG